MCDGMSKAIRVGELKERERVMAWLNRVEWRSLGNSRRTVDIRHWLFILERISTGSEVRS